MKPERFAWALALCGGLIGLALLAIPSDPANSGANPKLGAGIGANQPTTTRADRPELGLDPLGPLERIMGDGRIHGHVVDRELGPLGEGRMHVFCSGSVHGASVGIGEDGEFELPNCPTGPSCLRLVHPTAVQTGPWELEVGGEAREVELEAEGASTLEGTIRDARGTGVAGAELILQRGSSGPTSANPSMNEVATVATASDEHGEYRIGLPHPRVCDRCDDVAASSPSTCVVELASAEAVRVLVSAKGFAPASAEFELGPRGRVMDLELQPPGPAIHGRVIGEDGEPFDQRTRVLATRHGNELERHAAMVDEGGKFSFDGLASEGEYSLRAIRDEREVAIRASARPGEEVALESDLVPGGATLAVELVDASGEPIPNVRVDGGPFRYAVSDKAGRVEATAVLPGTYTLRVRSDQCALERVTIELERDVSDWVRQVELLANC